MASIVVVQRAGGDAGVRECRDRGCAALRDRDGGDCRQISYRRNRASAEERKSSCYDVRQGRRYPPNRRRHPFGGRSLPRFFVATPGTPTTSWRTSPPFSEIGNECARRRLLPPPQAVSAEVHGLSVGGFPFPGDGGVASADRRNVVSACRTASRTIGKTRRPTLRAGEHAWNSTGAQAGKYGIPTPIPPSTCCSTTAADLADLATLFRNRCGTQA